MTVLFLLVGSSAGLLMTSQTTIDENVFGDLGLSRSLKSSEIDREKLRRRHKSASDIGLQRAATLQRYDTKLRHQSSDLDHLQLSNALSAKISQEMEQGKAREGSEKGNSRSSGPSIKPGHSTILESRQETSDCASKIGESKDVIRTTENGDVGCLIRPLLGLDLKDKSPKSSGVNNINAQILDTIPNRVEPVRALGKKPDDIFSDLEDLKTPIARTNSVGSSTSSPSHSVRTPVTENDPLGLFSSPMSSTTIQTSLSGTPDLLGLNDSKDSGISTATSKSANRSNMLIDIEPSRSPSKDRLSSTDSALSTPKNHGAGDVDTRMYTLLKTSSSTSSNETSSPGSLVGTWAPLSQSMSTPGDRGDGQPREEDTCHKACTLPANLENLENTPDNKPHGGIQSSKRGKILARGESFRSVLSSTAKSTASFFSSRFSSKFAEIKQSMAPASNAKIESGGTTKLPKAHEMDNNLVEDEARVEKVLKKAGSEELLDTSRENYRNQSDSRSLDDNLDGTPRKSRQTVVTKGYAGYGELLNIWYHCISFSAPNFICM